MNEHEGRQHLWRATAKGNYLAVSGLVNGAQSDMSSEATLTVEWVFIAWLL